MLIDGARYIFLFNGGTADRRVIANDGSWNTQYKSILLEAGTWTEIRLTVTEFSSLKSIGIAYPYYNDNACEYGISLIYAIKNQ